MVKVYCDSWFGLLLWIALACTEPRIACGEDAKRPNLPPAIESVLAWLPESTETIVVGQSFVIRARDVRFAAYRASKQSRDFFETMPETALGALVEPEMEKYLKPLAGKKVVLAIRGGRNHEWVSSTLPTYRTEGCAVLIFENDLGDARTELVNALRTGAQEVRKMAGRSIFVFPPTQAMHAARKSEWPGKLGVYLAMLNPDAILCATSDKYLEDLLERVDAPQARRALPEDLPEWKHLDPAAPAWMLRHISKGRGRRVIQGANWAVTKDQIRAVYIPVAGEEKRAGSVARGNWQPDPEEPQLAPDVRPTLERGADGTVVVSSTTENLSYEALFLISMNLYWLEAQSSDSGE